MAAAGGTGVTQVARRGIQQSFTGAGTAKFQFVTQPEREQVTFFWVGSQGGTLNLPRSISNYNGASNGRFDLYQGNIAGQEMNFQGFRATATGNWCWSSTLWADGVTRAYAITYDGSSTSNDPIGYINGVAFAPATEITTPVGALVTAGTATAVGGRPDVTTRQHEGGLEMALRFDRVLTRAEIMSLVQAPYQVFAPRRLWIPGQTVGAAPSYVRPTIVVTRQPIVRSRTW